MSSRFCDGGGYQAGYQAARELVAENPGMQALFAPPICWRWAPRTACADAAAPLPAIVGFDDIPQADWQPYQLTTVQQNTALLAHHALDLLMTRIARFSLPSRHREVPVKLIIRHSARNEKIILCWSDHRIFLRNPATLIRPFRAVFFHAKCTRVQNRGVTYAISGIRSATGPLPSWPASWRRGLSWRLNTINSARR